ncbi:MAG: hypothetical protein EOM74_04475 [Methanomicrobia archaeon]|nr:hypothetical protein [Methanomicrobia archaeon]
MFYAITNDGLILLLLIAIFAGVALLVWLLRNLIPGIKDKDGRIDHEKAVQEELDRVLVKIEEPEVKKAIEDFKDNDKK